MKKRKALAVFLRIISFAMFIVTPAMVISEKFPLWKQQGGSGTAIGSGAVILLAIAFITFRKYITAWVTEKLGTMSAGVSLAFFWSVLAIVCMLLAKITTILYDLSTVFTWSAIGAVVGLCFQGFARLAEREQKEKRVTDEETD